MTSEPRTISLDPYHGPWLEDDKDANFKQQVAQYAPVDPMPTLDRMSRGMNVPVGSLVRYILTKFAASGSEGLLEIGPRVIYQMAEMIERAESAGTDEARLEAYKALTQVVSWLRVPLDAPDWRPGGWRRPPSDTAEEQG